MCWRKEKDIQENGRMSGREMIIENEGKCVEVWEREFEESASDDEEGVASIGEGSSVGRNTAREGWGEENGALAREVSKL